MRDVVSSQVMLRKAHLSLAHGSFFGPILPSTRVCSGSSRLTFGSNGSLHFSQKNGL